MDTPARSPALPPQRQPACPLCGGANACAVAASGRFDTPCWCRSASFPAGVLARVPAAQRGIACVCAACAGGSAATAAHDLGTTEGHADTPGHRASQALTIEAPRRAG